MNKVLDFLYKDKLFYIDMIEGLNRKLAEVVNFCDDGLLLFYPQSQLFSITAKTEETFSTLVKNIKNPDLIVCHENFYKDELEQKFDFKENLLVYQCAYLKNKIEKPENKKFTIRQASMNLANEIFKNYSNPTIDIEYIEDRIKNNLMYCTFYDEELAAFIGVHGEGSIGFLEVIEKYRNQKLAVILTSFMIDNQLKQGFVPFSQIIAGNNISVSLHKKLGFDISEKIITWLLK